MDTSKQAHNSGLLGSQFLSAQELFKWRKRENLSVPQRGGIKDFEPDDSWLQAKRLEAFYEEQQSVLAEPRVEKSGNLVMGVWDAEVKLVNIEKTGKFWMKMGFVDQHRNWLHPEEALFLMEVNCLSVSYQGLQLSLQEAYSLFLSPATDVTVEEYQVYGHLRRLGYIVIRHAGKLEVTLYERKIGLDKHIKKKKRHQKKTETDSTVKMEDKTNNCKTAGTTDKVLGRGTNPQKTERCESAGVLPMDVSEENCTTSSNSREHNVDKETHSVFKRKLPNDDKTDAELADSTAEPAVKKKKDSEVQLLNCPARNLQPMAADFQLSSSAKDTNQKDQDFSASSTPAQQVRSSSLTAPASGDLWSRATAKTLSRTRAASAEKSESRTVYTVWDFSAIKFPDIAGKETVVLDIPAPDLLPPRVVLNEEFDDVCMFDVEDYRRQQMSQHFRDYDSEMGDRHLRNLQFSYAEWMQKHAKPIKARNWGEWKAAMQERLQSSLFESPVAHLWKGDVQPLVQPKDSTSTAALLEKLSVIKPFQGPLPGKQSPVKIAFDVYLPNTTFRKTSPGVPDHRVCVARGDHPPDLLEIHSATAHLDDDVPLHWAVVNSGEISFFIFDNFSLPVHPSSLG